MKIRKYQEADWNHVWPIIEKAFRSGETYAFSPEITEDEAHKVWIESPKETYVSIDEDSEILGTYYIKPNQPTLGSHVCNCGYIVSENARGKGVASNMCEHSQEIAITLGFRAMQYNLVVSTNEGAIRLWKKLGFQVVGNLPRAFNSKSVGYIDALVMYKELKYNEALNLDAAKSAAPVS
jgi:RimJ/RimL family protein N-acetyltransferase